MFTGNKARYIVGNIISQAWVSNDGRRKRSGTDYACTIRAREDGKIREYTCYTDKGVAQLIIYLSTVTPSTIVRAQVRHDSGVLWWKIYELLEITILEQ